MKKAVIRSISPGMCAIASALLLILGILHPPYYIGLVFLIPMILFAVLAVVAYKHSNLAIAANVITIVLTIVFAVLALLFAFYLAFFESSYPWEDPQYYTRVYNKYSKDSVVAEVFPERIPDGAEDVRFHYHGQFLQGGGEFSLAYRDDPASLEPIMAELAGKAVWYGALSELYDWVDRPSYFDGESFCGTYGIPDDSTVYLIDYRNPYGEDETGYSFWNHGEYVIAALSHKSGAVVYCHCYW